MVFEKTHVECSARAFGLGPRKYFAALEREEKDSWCGREADGMVILTENDIDLQAVGKTSSAIRKSDDVTAMRSLKLVQCYEAGF